MSVLKALVLAGGAPQIALIEELKRRNIFTILADYNENPVARKHADLFYQVSTLDVEAITKVAQKEQVDFLITVCTDQALLTVAYVSEQLDLPCYIDYQTALNVTNKSYMKKIFAENGIPSAKHVIMSEFDDERIKELSYPLMVKPVDCNSSKGVKKVYDYEELKKAFDEATLLSRTKAAVIEEFIDGVELSVDVYVEDGLAHVLSVSRLDKMDNVDKFIIYRSSCPAKEAGVIADNIHEVAQCIADAFVLKNTPMLIQMIVREGRIYVLEFSARTGGGEKYIVIKKMSGFDVIKAVVDLTLGIKPHVDECSRKRKYIVSEFVYCMPGEFQRLEGFEEAKRNGLISEYESYKWKGARFNTVESSGDRVAGYSIEAATQEELFGKHRTIMKMIKVIDSKGNDMMRRDHITDLV